jgi:outer membrane protein assembly factor BamA
LNSEKQKLLRENYVLSSTPKPDKSEMRGYIKQRPNRRILTVPFYLWIYNSVNPKREARRVKRHDEKFKAKYNRWREYQSRHKKKEPQRKRTWGEFLYSIGEAPVVYDSIAAQQTCKQLQLYLHNKGYFEGEVRDTFFYRRLKRKQREALVQSLTDSTVKLPHLARLNRGAQRRVHVYYYFKTGTPYTINSVNWVIEDSLMKNNVLSSKDSSYLIPQKAGEIVNYDMDVFSAERDRITSNLRNQGYFLFNKEYIRFAIDSTAKEHKVDVTIIIRNRQELQSDSSLVSVGHKQYTIRKITVRTLASVQELKNDTARLDTLIWTDRAGTRTIHFYRNISLEEQFNIKPEVLAARIRVNREGTLYSQSAIDATYRQLNGLRVFRQVIISPHLGAEDQVDCDIYLLPTLRQSFITQLEGTNTGGNLGLAGQIGFQNNNLLHGAELLDIRLKGGTEAQQAITANQQINAAQQVTLNTIEAAAEISLNIPRAFFPFNKLPIGQAEGRRTTFTFSVNYQRRLDYDRALFNLSYGYTFALGSNGFMGIYPLEFNVVSVTTKAGLAEFLINNRDPLLRYRFTDHFINESRLTYVLKKQYRSRFKPVHYLRTDLGLSGNILRKAFEWSSAERDSIGSYLIAGIPFSQYVRLTFTYIYSMQLGDHQQLVFRIAQGAGLPLTNFPTMPLEKSFFGGGANGIRAWEARSLGPGSYSVPSGERFAQFGDVQAEYNIELRFRITKTLFGALFADGGNIWLIRPDAARPNGDFRVDRFLEDLAFGPGIGLRYDLSFFIARLDWALQVRDPAYSRGDRWYVFQRPLSSNLNFGIGYPF